MWTVHEAPKELKPGMNLRGVGVASERQTPVRSPPPCGEGLGVGVVRFELTLSTPTPTLRCARVDPPLKGEGNRPSLWRSFYSKQSHARPHRRTCYSRASTPGGL